MLAWKRNGCLVGGRSGPVGAVLEDGGDRFVRTGVEQQGTGAGGVDALLAVALDQPENADGGAEALFRMRSRPQDDVDQGVDVGADLGCFGTNTLMGPVAITTMRARHMLNNRRRAMRQGAAQMRRHPLAAQENLDSLLGDAGLDLLTHEVVRDAVVMLGDLDVIIEVDPAALPLGILVRFIRQGSERRTIELFEQVAPTSSPTPERSVVQLDQECVDRLVEGGEGEESAVAQTRENPSSDDLDPDFDLGFVAWTIRSRRDDGGAVMAGEICIRPVDHRFVKAGPGDASLQIVAHRLPGHAAEI